MGAGSRFGDLLWFDDDGSLGVWGPTNFEPGDLKLTIKDVQIRSRGGVIVKQTFDPPIEAWAPAARWEGYIEDARDRGLRVGRARGTAKGKIKRADGSESIWWPDEFEIVDGRTFLRDWDG
jgi:hypothetical protein